MDIEAAACGTCGEAATGEVVPSPFRHLVMSVCRNLANICRLPSEAEPEGLHVLHRLRYELEIGAHGMQGDRKSVV